MMPISSISCGRGVPDGVGEAQRRIRGTIATRAAGVSSLESLTPVGALRQVSSMRTTPTVTGPARAPRPTSSIAAPGRGARRAGGRARPAGSACGSRDGQRPVARCGHGSGAAGRRRHLGRRRSPRRRRLPCGACAGLAAARGAGRHGAKVAVGLDSQVRWSSGQTRATARPTMSRSSTDPWLPLFSGPSWARESAELERWSPITQTRPRGTVMSKSWSLAASPGLRYGSLIALPLMVIRPPSSQQTTWSPGSPMTRLIRWFSELSGSRPTKVRVSRTTRDDRAVAAPWGRRRASWPGSANTTMSPRLQVDRARRQLADDDPVVEDAGCPPSTPTGCRTPGAARS